ncbi:hypothetical protein [Actinoplanes sp. NPDC051851]|uniref:hypothetical protein n=1 Tax=Actinoplanes sp. NPDC051851 TaxID=3154753 RepID=UPI00341C1566
MTSTALDVDFGGHDPTPAFLCKSCGWPWPCDPARASLTEKYDRAAAATIMWVFLEDAVRVMPNASSAILFARFLKWTGGDR